MLLKYIILEIEEETGRLLDPVEHFGTSTSLQQHQQEVPSLPLGVVPDHNCLPHNIPSIIVIIQKRKSKTKELQVTLYCTLTPPVTKQSARAITLDDTDRQY